MRLLEEKIKNDGKILSDQVLKVDCNAYMRLLDRAF